MTLFTPEKERSNQRTQNYRPLRCVTAFAALLLAGFFMILIAPSSAFALDDETSLQERHIRFTYGYTECEGTVHPQSRDGVYDSDGSNTEYPRNFTVTMMLCDSKHIVRVEGDDVTSDKVTLESLSPSVLEIDSDGNVTLLKTGTAQIKATVAADDMYNECTAKLYVKVDKHDAWARPELRAYYDDRPLDWWLDLDTSDGPHQIAKNLRPGAEFVRFASGDLSVAYVDQNGLVTPVSAGTTNIIIETDDGGGKYKACLFATTIVVTGEDVLLDQEITGDLGRFEVDNYRDGLQLDLHAQTDLEYYSIGSDSEYVHVDQNGFVEFTQTASGIILVVARPSDIYKPAEVEISVTAYDRQASLANRNVRFTYGCTSCDGSLRPCTDEGVYKTSSSNSADYFTTNMMMCDKDHVVGLIGNGLNGADVTLTSLNSNILEIDNSGNVTLKDIGTARIKALISSDSTYATCTAYLTVNIDRHAPYYDDIPFYYYGRSGQNLDLDTSDKAQQLVMPLRPGVSVISFTSDDPDIVSVDRNGIVTPKAPGHTVLRLTIDDCGGKYKAMESSLPLDITITGKAPASGQTTAVEQTSGAPTKQAISKTSKKTELAKAKSLKRPTFKVKALKKHKIKLTWGKVANADGYIVYVRYPGSKKYVKAVTRKASVKSVTHKGLTKGKVYRYKVRAYKKVKGKTYYGPYSKIRKARAK